MFESFSFSFSPEKDVQWKGFVDLVKLLASWENGNVDISKAFYFGHNGTRLKSHCVSPFFADTMTK